MPMILFKFKRILYWGKADQVMDFTTTFNVASYTAHAAMDEKSPRYLRVAGDQVSARDIVGIAGEVMGEKFKMIKAGSVGFLDFLIRMIKTFSPSPNDLYPAWQGMQYMRDMAEGRVKLSIMITIDIPESLGRQLKSFCCLSK